MALTTKQIVYGSVLALAAGAFAWDRATSGPAPAAAAPTGELVRGNEKPRPAQQAAATLVRIGLGTRLQELARSEHLVPGVVDDAFALTPAWPRKDDTAKPATKPAEDAVLASAFAKKHRLEAVVVRGKGGYALLDGRAVLVGQTIDHFKLVAVTQTTATFVRGTARVELQLVTESKLVREGPTIEDKASDPPEIIEPAGK